LTWNPIRLQGSSEDGDNGFQRGYFGSFSGNDEDVDFGTWENPYGKLNLSIRTEPKLTIDVNGDVGIGTTNPTEKLTISSGNLKLTNSEKGILLNASNSPLITRGWNPFASGIYNGIGRWGLFLHNDRLTIGIPNLSGKEFEFARYNVTGTRETLLTINHEGAVKRPVQDDVDLLPIAIGVVNNFPISSSGSFFSVHGTGNFTVEKMGTGLFHITLDGELYSRDKHIVSASGKVSVFPLSDTPFVSTAQSPDGDLIISIFAANGSYLDQGFQFIIYRPF